jgi:endoglycosylceramidase
MNEPWAGDAVSNPLLMVPSVADRQRLQPAYDELVTGIWEEDPTRLVFFDGVTWDDDAPAGFTHAPGNRPDLSVFSFHFYEPPQYNFEPFFRLRNKDGERLQVGLALTEFSGYGYGQLPEEGKPTFDQVVNICDQYQLSWM